MKNYSPPVPLTLAARVALAFLAVAVAAQASLQAAESYSATVRLSDRVLNTVKPLLFGDNIEWTNDGMGFWLP